MIISLYCNSVRGYIIYSHLQCTNSLDRPSSRVVKKHDYRINHKNYIYNINYAPDIVHTLDSL